MIFLDRASIDASPGTMPPEGEDLTVTFEIESDQPTRFVTWYSLFSDVPFRFAGATPQDPEPEVEARVVSPKEVEVTGRTASPSPQTYSTKLEVRADGPLGENTDLQVNIVVQELVDPDPEPVVEPETDLQVNIVVQELGEDGKPTGAPKVGYCLTPIVG